MLNLPKILRSSLLCVSALLFPLQILANAAFDETNHQLNRQGLKLSVKEIKTARSNPKSNILLVHGITYSSHQFDVNYEDYSFARFLAKHGYRVWLLDITGYGRSSKPENGFTVDTDYAAKDIALATDYIRKSAQVNQIDVLGWSWGTITTARFAAVHPEWVHKLILYAPIYRGLDLPEPADDYQSFSVAASQSDFIKSKTDSGQIDYDIIHKEIVELYTQQCITYDSAGSPNGGRRDLFQDDETKLFKPEKLTMPVLIIAGSHDPYLDFKNDIPEIVELLPNHCSRYQIVEEGSHALFLEKAHYRAFQKSVLNFLQDDNCGN